MKGFALMVVVALACLMIDTQCAPQEYVMPKYISVGTCDDTCIQHPHAVCKEDCVSLAADGSGVDCVNNFYNPDGHVVYCFEN